jgi:hypothetical protein
MIDAPARWAEVLFRGATAAGVAFVVLQAKEFLDAGRFDTPGTAADAALIAGGILLLNATLKAAGSK